MNKTRNVTTLSRHESLVPDVLPASAPPPDYRPVTNLARNGQSFTEKGGIGTTYFSGFLYGEEYLKELQGLAAIAVYDRMWRSDGTIGALKRAMTHPLLQATWDVKAASDDPQDVEIAQHVRDNLIHGLTGGWRSHLLHALLMYRDGHSVFYKVWTKGDDGKIRLKSLSPRLSKTLYRWYVDPDGTLDHIQQRVYIPGPEGKPGTYELVDLDGEDLVVYTYDKEGANYQGVSVLRNAYKHFFIKDQLYHIDAIAAERNALGVPVFKEPQNADDANRDKAADTLANLHAHERSYILEPFGWEFRIEGLSGQVRNIMPSIEHHDLLIVKSILATFINQDKLGSYAKDWSETSLFLQNLHGVADYIVEMVNHDVIRPLVDYNWTVDRYPTLVCSKLDKRDVSEYLRGVAAMFAAKALTQSIETENAIRVQMDLPELPMVDTNGDGIGDAPTGKGQGPAAAGKAPETEDATPTQEVAAIA